MEDEEVMMLQLGKCKISEARRSEADYSHLGSRLVRCMTVIYGVVWCRVGKCRVKTKIPDVHFST